MQTSKRDLETQLKSLRQELVASQDENSRHLMSISELDLLVSQGRDLDAGLTESPAKRINEKSEHLNEEQLKQLKEKANRLLEKKSEPFINVFFERCVTEHFVRSHDGKKLLSATGLQAALKEMDVPVTLEEASALVKMHDINGAPGGNGSLGSSSARVGR